MTYADIHLNLADLVAGEQITAAWLIPRVHGQAATGLAIVGSASTLGRHHLGIPPLAFFQLETVDGRRSSAVATFTVPPFASMI